jgi:hypothetical protein
MEIVTLFMWRLCEEKVYCVTGGDSRGMEGEGSWFT